MSYGLTIDPGMESGLCLFSYGDDQPFTVEQLWQFPGGVEAFSAFIEGSGMRLGGVSGLLFFQDVILDALVVEKFTPRPHESFQLTLKTIEPLRCEGALIMAGVGPKIIWREPSAQYFMSAPDTPLAQKKKDSREFLETIGIKPTGKQFDRPNADDAISAILHSIAWLRKARHMPTLEALFGEENE